jgi:hypothetical protein
VSNAKAAGGGALLGVVIAIGIIIFVAMAGWYKGKETPVPCTSADWKAYAAQCNRFTPEPSDHPPVITPQK